MSKFLRAMTEEMIRGRSRYFIKPLQVEAYDENLSTYHTIPDQLETYRFKISWWFDQVCQPEMKDRAKVHVLHQIRELIFGEFREKLFDIQNEVMAGEMRKASEMIENLQKELYNG